LITPGLITPGLITQEGVRHGLETSICLP
jgi:hypothetical protein